MEKDIEKRPENMDKMYAEEELNFLCQYKMRSAILRVLKENFEVREMIVISQKVEEKNDHI